MDITSTHIDHGMGKLNGEKMKKKKKKKRKKKKRKRDAISNLHRLYGAEGGKGSGTRSLGSGSVEAAKPIRDQSTERELSSIIFNEDGKGSVRTGTEKKDKVKEVSHTHKTIRNASGTALDGPEPPSKKSRSSFDSYGPFISEGTLLSALDNGGAMCGNRISSVAGSSKASTRSDRNHSVLAYVTDALDDHLSAGVTVDSVVASKLQGRSILLDNIDAIDVKHTQGSRTQGNPRKLGRFAVGDAKAARQAATRRRLDRTSGVRGGRHETSKQRREALRRRQRLPKSMQKYDLYVPLNDLWRGYILDLMGLERANNGQDMGDGHSLAQERISPPAAIPSSSSSSSPSAECASPSRHEAIISSHHASQLSSNTTLSARLLRVDLSGAIISLVRSSCPSRIGLRGIVLTETKEAFRIVTKKDRVLTIPKRDTVFEVVLPVRVGSTEGAAGSENEQEMEGGTYMSMTIFGSFFRYPAFERSKRKFKQQASLQLQSRAIRV